MLPSVVQMTFTVRCSTWVKKLKLAIIGQGRSGRDIHGAFYKSEKNDLFDVAVVVEADARRRERALAEYPGCEVVECYQGLFGREDIDLPWEKTDMAEQLKSRLGL